MLGTPFNSGGYTLTELSQAFRTYEDFGRIRTKTWSVFANADAELTDQLKLTVGVRSEEHTSELQSLMRNSYGVFCLKKKTTENKDIENTSSPVLSETE